MLLSETWWNRFRYADGRINDALEVFVRDWTLTAQLEPWGLNRSYPTSTSRLMAAVPYSPEDYPTAVAQLGPNSGLPILVVEGHQTEPNAGLRLERGNLMMSLSPRLIPPKVFAGTETCTDRDEFLKTWRNLSGSSEDLPQGLISPSTRSGVHEVLLRVGEDGRYIATVRLTFGDNLGGLSLLAVSESVRRRGIARALLQHAVTKLPATVSAIHLQVDSANPAGKALYEGLGGETVATYGYWQLGRNGHSLPTP